MQEYFPVKSYQKARGKDSHRQIILKDVRADILPPQKNKIIKFMSIIDNTKCPRGHWNLPLTVLVY